MVQSAFQTPNVANLRAGDQDSRPRVHLPPTQPRVNLPQMPAHWTVLPPSNHFTSPVAPNAMTYDQSFPNLGASQAQVNIPTYPPMQLNYPQTLSQPAGNNFEDQMRGMIMGSNVQGGQPNHAHRRQRDGQADVRFQTSQPFQRQDFKPSPHLRGVAPPNGPNRTTSSQYQGYNRPPPHHKQLYNPALSGQQTQRFDRYQERNSSFSLQAQVDYLDRVAWLEIPKVEMSLTEYDQKEKLRKSLEQACRKVVYEHEKIANGLELGADTVALKCFGSMSTTFATKSSDMDLVLLLPLSEPSVSDHRSEIPRLIEKALLDLEYGVRLLTKTRVPIIRFCEKPTPELRELLLKERDKAEKEQDKSSLTSLEKSARKSKGSVKDRPDPTLPHNRPSHLPQQCLALDRLVLTDSKEPKDKPVVKSASADTLEGMPRNSMQKEGDDPELSAKSDEERCRLYHLAIQEGWFEPAERKVINAYMSTIRRRSSTDDEKITARAPLSELPNVLGRYRAPPEAHPLEFPKNGVGIQCDINFSNHLALHNSHLLKCYSLCDRRVRLMVLFVKAWTKRRKINTPYHGTLSSYGYVLMVLHYLINIARPPVLINLQRTSQAFEDETSSMEVELEGHNIQFLRNEAVIENLLKLNAITSNTESVGSLLRGFFHYYAHQGSNSPAGGFSWLADVLSVRTVGGIIPKTAKGWTGAKTETVDLKGPGPQQTKEIRQRYLLAIEDPFEIEHNIARTVVHNGIVAIRDEFRRALKLIEHAGVSSGNRQEDLFAEAEDKENLQYRVFGPRPRNGFDRKDNIRPNGGHREAKTTVGHGGGPIAVPSSR